MNLPELYSENSYLVPKGTSCYGAINNYVSAVSGTPVYATPENVLKTYEKNSTVKRLDDYNILSLSYVINRSEPISEIDYKINSADNYSYHFKSGFVQKMGIERKRMMNLSSIPLWQRGRKCRYKNGFYNSERRGSELCSVWLFGLCTGRRRDSAYKQCRRNGRGRHQNEKRKTFYRRNIHNINRQCENNAEK